MALGRRQFVRDACALAAVGLVGLPAQMTSAASAQVISNTTNFVPQYARANPKPGNSYFSSLPGFRNLMLDFDPASIKTAANLGSAPDWVDQVSGLVAHPAPGAGPTWLSNAFNGFPGVKGAGSQSMKVIDPGNWLGNKIDKRNYTFMAITVNTAAAANGCLMGAANSVNGFFARCDGTRFGMHNNSDLTSSYPPSAPSGFNLWGFTAGNSNHGGSAQLSGLGRLYFGPMCKGPISLDRMGVESPGTGIGLFSSNGNGGLTSKTTALRILMWDRELTPVEWAKWAIFLTDYYGGTISARTSDYVFGFDGDSLTGNVAATSMEKGMPYLVAQGLGLADDAWFNVAIGGYHTVEAIAKAPFELDGIAAALGRTLFLHYHNWFNDKSKSIATIHGDHKTYIAARAAANAGAKFTTNTPADYADSSTPNPSAWVTELTNATQLADMGYSGVARVDLDSTIGSNGGLWNLYPNSGPYSTPFADGIHFADYTGWATSIIALIASLR